MTSKEEKQVSMHKDLFDRCKDALDNGFYFEALLLEYAAIEGRLEVILGVLGLPCCKNLAQTLRKDMKILHRIQCLNKIYKHTNNANGTKLSPKFFANKGELKTWTTSRNIYIHGLYKNADIYSERLDHVKELAEQGYLYAKLLYNEAKRLRNLKKNHPDTFENCEGMCFTASCKVNCNTANDDEATAES